MQLNTCINIVCINTNLGECSLKNFSLLSFVPRVTNSPAWRSVTSLSYERMASSDGLKYSTLYSSIPLSENNI